jgi:hypothetical protein
MSRLDGRPFARCPGLGPRRTLGGEPIDLSSSDEKAAQRPFAILPRSSRSRRGYCHEAYSPKPLACLSRFCSLRRVHGRTHVSASYAPPCKVRCRARLRREGLPARHLRGDRQSRCLPRHHDLESWGLRSGHSECKCPCHKKPEDEQAN